MAHKIIGTHVTIQNLIDAMMKSAANVVLSTEWTDLASRLGVDYNVIENIRIDRMHEKIRTDNALYIRIFTVWIKKDKEKATLGELVKALEKSQINDIIQCIEKEFYQDQESSESTNRNQSQQGTGGNQERSADRPDFGSDEQVNPTPIKLTEVELDFIKNEEPLEVKVVMPTKRVKRDDYYKLPKGNKGYALFINITEFDSKELKDRAGASNDMIYMKELWNQLGYDTSSSYQGRYTTSEINGFVADFLAKLEEENKEEEIKSCVSFIGSLGEHGLIHTSSGPPINLYDDFIYNITDSEVLKGKPKLFIVNACQGFSEDVRKRTKTDGTLRMPVEDTMLCFSIIPGKDSNRDPYLGSWYINCLTRVFMKNAHQLDLEEMLKLTQETMKYILTDGTDGQLPTHQPLLMKKLYFNLVPK